MMQRDYDKMVPFDSRATVFYCAYCTAYLKNKIDAYQPRITSLNRFFRFNNSDQ